MKSHQPNPRQVAALALVQIVDKDQTLDRILETIDPSAGKARIQEMLYGVLRWYHRLDALAGMLLKQGLKKRDRDIQMLLLIGLYELLYMDTDDYATVNETVSAANELNKTWAKGLLNACLRRAQREQEELQTRLEKQPQSRYSHPLWFIDLLRLQYPETWQQILQANNERPPMQLRVNTRATTRKDYLTLLTNSDIDASPLDSSAAAIALAIPIPVARLPAFDKGRVSVQDGAAQLAAELLDVRPGDRVLDACAAPGGKAGHLLERHPDMEELVVLERSPNRSEHIRENFQRLGVTAVIKIADALRPQDWWKGRPFQRILLDAPCSATGVIRRHPDIKLHRTPRHIAEASRLQGQILRALWPLLQSGGKLLYVTCSVLAAENQNQIEAFLETHADATEVALELGWAEQRFPGYQILPGTKELDGFYYACLQKN